MTMISEIRSAADAYSVAVAAISGVPDALEAAGSDYYPHDLARRLRAAAARDLIGWCLWNAELRGRLNGLNVHQADAALTRGALYQHHGRAAPFEPEPDRETGWNETQMIRHNEECLIKSADSIVDVLARCPNDEVALDAIGWVAGWLIVGDDAGEARTLESMY